MPECVSTALGKTLSRAARLHCPGNAVVPGGGADNDDVSLSPRPTSEGPQVTRHPRRAFPTCLRRTAHVRT